MGQIDGVPNETRVWDEETRMRVRRTHARGSATYRFTRKYPQATCWLIGRPSYSQRNSATDSVEDGR